MAARLDAPRVERNRFALDGVARPAAGLSTQSRLNFGVIREGDMRRIVMAGFVLACLSLGSAGAQQIDRSESAAIAADMEARLNAAPDPTLQPVEEITCEQMYSELMVAGQQMNAQLDPNFATNAQAMQDQINTAQRGMAGSMAMGIGQGIMCSIPGIGMACGAMMQAQMANQMRQGQEQQAQMDEMMAQMDAATEGIDMARMQAVNERWESEQCQAPAEAMPQSPMGATGQ
jgi:hypothetical protein